MSSVARTPEVDLLSRLTGQGVLGPGGRDIGRVVDLTVMLDQEEGPHLVARVLVRRRQALDLLVPWAAVECFEHDRVQLQVDVDVSRFAIDSVNDALGDGEILLCRDVLDTQIIDVAGQRLARVADVVVSRDADDRRVIVGVEVGFGGVLRRLGLRGLAAHYDEDVVAWTDLHLTSDRGHSVQLATPRSAVHHLNAAGLAALIGRLDIESATEVLVAAGPRMAAEVVDETHPVVGESVLRAMPTIEAARIVAAMPAERASHWQRRLMRSRRLLGRHFIRSRVSRRRHKPAPHE